MSNIEYVIDSSDRSVRKSKKYLKKIIFRSWLTGNPKIICEYTIETPEGIELLSFRDEKEVVKFARFLISQSNKFALELQEKR